jgi:hypothetical protein
MQMKLKVVQNRDSRNRSQQFLKKGMPVLMSDGWAGKIAFVADGFTHCDEDGPNLHCTGRAVKLSSLKVSRGIVTINWASRSNSTRNTRKSVRLPNEQHRAVVVDLDRAKLEREWKDAPED